MNLRCSIISEKFNIDTAHIPLDKCSDAFLDFLENNEKTDDGKALNEKITHAVIGFLKEKSKKGYSKDPNIGKGYKKITGEALKISKHFDCGDILELSFNDYKGFLPVAVYPVNFTAEEETAEICDFKDFSLTKGLVSISKAQFNMSANKKEEKEYEEYEERTFGDFLGEISFDFLKLGKKGLYKKLKGLNFRPFVLLDKSGQGFLLVPYRLDMSVFSRRMSDSKILKTVRILASDSHSLIGENYREDIYHFCVLMTLLGMYDEIEDKKNFFNDERFFAKDEECTLLPTTLHYMNNSDLLKMIISKGLCSFSEFSYNNEKRETAVREFKNDLAGKKKNTSLKGNPFKDIYNELFKEAVKVTTGNGQNPKIIPFFDFLKNEDGYTVGSKKAEAGEKHIYIPGENVGRVHGVIFFDESVDSLVYRRTTIKDRTLYEGKAAADDTEIFDGALIYIGDTLCKFEYITKKGN